MSTENATNTITATAVDSAASVEIKNGTTTVQSGSAATWAEGENTVKVTVRYGTTKRVYTVKVTYTPPSPPEA